jgi:hypothetical protein
VIFFAVFDHGKLQPEVQLRRRKPHAGRLVHAGSHGIDQFLNFAAAYFRNAQRASALTQNGISSLNNFKFHGIHNFRSRAIVKRALLDFISICEDIREEGRDKMKS